MAQCLILGTLLLLVSWGSEQKKKKHTHFTVNLVQVFPFLFCLSVSANLQKLMWSFICFFFLFCYFPLESFASHHAHRQDRQPAKHLCVFLRASVNPFCQVSAELFLSKLPAGSLSLLCWWEKLEEKACGTPAAPRLGLGSSARKGRAWDLVLERALCGSCDWRFNRLSPGRPMQPYIPCHTSETGGGKDNYTHIQQPHTPSLSTVLQLWCIPVYQSFKNISKVSCVLNNLQISLAVWKACLEFQHGVKVAGVYLILSKLSFPKVNSALSYFLSISLDIWKIEVMDKDLSLKVQLMPSRMDCQ